MNILKFLLVGFVSVVILGCSATQSPPDKYDPKTGRKYTAAERIEAQHPEFEHVDCSSVTQSSTIIEENKKMPCIIWTPIHYYDERSRIEAAVKRKEIE